MARKFNVISVGPTWASSKYNFRAEIGYQDPRMAMNSKQFARNVKEIKDYLQSKFGSVETDFAFLGERSQYVYFKKEEDLFEFLIVFGEIVKIYVSSKQHFRLRFPGTG